MADETAPVDESYDPVKKLERQVQRSMGEPFIGIVSKEQLEGFRSAGKATKVSISQERDDSDARLVADLVRASLYADKLPGELYLKAATRLAELSKSPAHISEPKPESAAEYLARDSLQQLQKETAESLRGCLYWLKMLPPDQYVDLLLAVRCNRLRPVSREAHIDALTNTISDGFHANDQITNYP